MLADDESYPQHGQFGSDIQLPEEARLELLAFIAGELPRWRDDPELPATTPDTAETLLTEHLCDHLEDAARHSRGFRRYKFRTEPSDEGGRGRKIDFGVKPSGAAIIIGSHRYSRFDMLLPFECKRLPIPKKKRRDVREYLTSRYSTTGGVQRFKDGHHGSAHRLAGMIAYIQEGTIEEWHHQLSAWIRELEQDDASGWKEGEELQPLNSYDSTVGQFDSNHPRRGGLSNIQIRHLWIQMN